MKKNEKWIISLLMVGVCWALILIGIGSTWAGLLGLTIWSMALGATLHQRFTRLP